MQYQTSKISRFQPLAFFAVVGLAACTNPVNVLQDTYIVERGTVIETVTTDIGDSGGICVLGDESDGTLFRIEVPPGSFVADAEITATAYEYLGEAPYGSSIVDSRIWQVLVTTFADQNSLILTVPIIGGIEWGSTYELVTREEPWEPWVSVESRIDRGRDIIEARVSHFSWFAVLSRPQPKGEPIDTPAVVLKFYNGLNDRVAVTKALETISQHGIKSVIAPVRNDDRNTIGGKVGTAYYQSAVISESDNAYLFEMAVLEARRLGLKIYAWLSALHDELRIE